ncbi:MAG: hypothetical protein S4CHLAM102_00950 [Chlamydiia bacterium]|nr:hypothetical protein [Chlamydiia bacterium]
MQREHWKSRLGFMWSAIGSAVGLGSIWRFPYLVGENGGAVFVMLFIVFLASVSMPVLISELIIGRKSQLNPDGAYGALGKGPFWRGVGKMTVVTGFLVSTFYSVISGWTLGYLIEAVMGKLIHFRSAGQSLGYFQTLSGSAWWALGCQLGFLVLSCWILYVGVQKGIEKWNMLLMPFLFVILALLVTYGLTLRGAGDGLKFLFSPDWSIVTPKTVLMALGQAFFGFSLGQGTMVTYGSYLSKKENVPGICAPIAFSIVLVSLLAGVAVFTIVFSTGVSPESGPNLMFQTLPLVFSQIPGGYLLSILFFLLIFLAGLTSQISAMEPVIAYFIDRWEWRRHQAVILCGVASFLVGIPSALAFGVLDGVTLFGANIFGIVSFVAVNILVPLGGLGAVILVGWKWGLKDAFAHLKEGAGRMFVDFPMMQPCLGFSIKYFVPVVILIILLNILGII